MIGATEVGRAGGAEAGVRAEAARRRTFAIISHPDAGKTTLTEKLLLYAGVVAEAGAVRAKRSRRETRSDWMELERRRGISISSTALRFERDGSRTCRHEAASRASLASKLIPSLITSARLRTPCSAAMK